MEKIKKERQTTLDEFEIEESITLEDIEDLMDEEKEVEDDNNE